jgi:hypothetical protein
MAPSSDYKVASLKSHISKVKSANSKDKTPATKKAAPVAKDQPADSKNANNLFGSSNDDDSDDSDDATSNSDSSDNEAAGSNFLARLTASKKPNGTAASKSQTKNVEVADSQAELPTTKPQKPIANGRETKTKSATAKPDSSSSSSSSDSDSDGQSVVTSTPVKSSAKADGSSSSSEEDSSSESEAELGPVEKKAANDAEPPKAVESDQDSSSEDDSSEDEEEEESEDEGQAQPVSQAKPEAAPLPKDMNRDDPTSDTSSEEDTDSDDEAEPEPAPKPAPKPAAAAVAKTQAPKTASKPAAKSNPVVSSSDDESSEDEDMADASMHIADRNMDKQLAVPNFIAPDFMLRRSDEGLNGKDVAKICSQANLEGKQLWYFTVPSNVPVTVVQNMEIPMDAAQRSDRAFSHNGEDYGMTFSNPSSKTSFQILIPSADGPSYQTCKCSGP